MHKHIIALIFVFTCNMVYLFFLFFHMAYKNMLLVLVFTSVHIIVIVLNYYIHICQIWPS